jgi:hypothetical protein
MFSVGCSVASENGDGPAATPLPASGNANVKHANASNAGRSNAAEQAEKSDAVSKCYEVDTGDNILLKRQTFAIDFEPFHGACFVTSHNPEFDEPPMESEFAIYKDGKRVFDFPSQFNGISFGCWIDAVGFQDLNADHLTDIVVVGKCSGKSATFNENMIYVNTGKAFVTDEDKISTIATATNVKEITAAVRRDPAKFFK